MTSDMLYMNSQVAFGNKTLTSTGLAYASDGIVRFIVYHNFGPLLFLTNASIASTPACATSASWMGVPVLTPMAPTTAPSIVIGNPPPIMQKRPPFVLWMPKAGPPGMKFFAAGELVYVDVGILWPAAVKALSIEMLIEVSFALGIRAKDRRCKVLSTMAILKSVDYDLSELWSVDG